MPFYLSSIKIVVAKLNYLCNYLSMRLGTVLRKWRILDGRSIREGAKEIGTSPATLLRIEKEYPCDSGTLAAVLLWLIGKNVQRKAK